MISTLPVVLMSSAARHDALWVAMLASVGVTYIDKPVDVQKLLDLLQTQATLHAVRVDSSRALGDDSFRARGRAYAMWDDLRQDQREGGALVCGG